ncbi:MAG TPA: hypothetical protein PKD86_01810 [Gemmatales bacterium]|nr:hypothetical protein [Gemmatales bacterium]HMP58063.1 hypothetical protein [Gemmatales bacterium]
MELPTVSTPFWPLLEHIAYQSQRRIVPSHEGGSVLLVPGDGAPPRSLMSCLSGPFRVRTKSLTAVRSFDDEAFERLILNLEVMWEPRYRPLLLQLAGNGVQLEENGQRRTIDQGGQVSWRLAGVGGLEWPLRLPRPPRSATVLDAVHLSATVLLPLKRLEVSFDEVGPSPAQRQEGVECRIVEVRTDPKSGRWQLVWTVTYTHFNPESHQTWMFADIAITLHSKSAVGGVLGSARPIQVSVDEKRSVRLVHTLPTLLTPLEDYQVIVHPLAEPIAHPLKAEFRDIPLP